jgi:uncharacterized protein (DUF4415 family)
MAKNERIESASAAEIEARRARGESRSDWAAAEAMPQAEVERLAAEEDGPLPEGWADAAMPGLPPRKEAVHIRLDADVLAWFRGHGPGYQTRINAVLRSFVAARGGAGKAR